MTLLPSPLHRRARRAFTRWQAGLRDLRRLMIAGGRVPAGEAGPIHVHQGDEAPRVLSGQILIHCRDRRRTARLARRAPLPGNPQRPYPDGCG